jgi:hypothetical protein
MCVCGDGLGKGGRVRTKQSYKFTQSVGMLESGGGYSSS